MVLVTTCRVTFADTDILLQSCIRHFELYSRAPIDVHWCTFWPSSSFILFCLGLGLYFLRKRLDYCLSSILSFTNKYQDPPWEPSLSLQMLVFLWTTLKQNFWRRKIYDPGFGRALLMIFLYGQKVTRA